MLHGIAWPAYATGPGGQAMDTLVYLARLNLTARTGSAVSDKQPAKPETRPWENELERVLR